MTPPGPKSRCLQGHQQRPRGESDPSAGCRRSLACGHSTAISASVSVALPLPSPYQDTCDDTGRTQIIQDKLSTSRSWTSSRVQSPAVEGDTLRLQASGRGHP